MATASITLSQFSSNVKSVHVGVVFAGGHASSTQTWSASGVLLLTKVPNGATIVDWWAKFGASNVATGNILKIGTSASPSGILSATTLSATYSASSQTVTPTEYGIRNQGWFRAPGPGNTLPARISLSDDVQPAEVWITAKLSVSMSGYFTFGLFYTNDGTTGRGTLR